MNYYDKVSVIYDRDIISSNKANRLYHKIRRKYELHIFMWNHDKRHPNPPHKFRCRYDSIEVKCILKLTNLSQSEHHPKEVYGR